jgi:phospholipase C
MQSKFLGLKTFLRAGVAALALAPMISQPALAAMTTKPPMTKANDSNTATPIKHVIVIVGENRTFDHLFATYV